MTWCEVCGAVEAGWIVDVGVRPARDDVPPGTMLVVDGTVIPAKRRSYVCDACIRRAGAAGVGVANEIRRENGWSSFEAGAAALARAADAFNARLDEPLKPGPDPVRSDAAKRGWRIRKAKRAKALANALVNAARRQR